jgi:hypothetical protein
MKKRAQLESGVIIYEDWQEQTEDGGVALERFIRIYSSGNSVCLWDKDVDKLVALLKKVEPS